MKNQTSLLKLCTIALLCLIAVACKEEISDPGPGEDKPFPFLKLGNEWKHHDITFSMNGTDTTRIYTDTVYTRRIDSVKSEYNDGVECIFLYITKADPAIDLNDDIWYAYDVRDSSFYPEEFKLVRWNCYLGQKILSREGANQKIYCEVVSMSEIIETPAGLFDCIKISRAEDKIVPEGTIDYDYYWFSKKYGLIKNESAWGTTEKYTKNEWMLISKNF